MTLQELRYLVAVADAGNFVRAAKCCDVGQPTLSMQLRKLEDQLGVPLLERNRRHLRPTLIGAEIIERARATLVLVDEIRQMARRNHDPMQGPLRLGVVSSLGPYLIPRLLPQLNRLFPLLGLLISEDLSAHLLDQLRQRRLDALLIGIPVGGADLDTLPLFREDYMVALSPGHVLAERAQITEAELAGADLLLLEEGYDVHDQAFSILGASPSAQREGLKATSFETLRQMVASGSGCTLLPLLATLPGAGGPHAGVLQLRPFAAPAPARTIGLVWRRRYPREAALCRLGRSIVGGLPRLDGLRPLAASDESPAL